MDKTLTFRRKITGLGPNKTGGSRQKVSGTVEVTINLEDLINHIGTRALVSAAGRATDAGGMIVAKLVKDAP